MLSEKVTYASIENPGGRLLFLIALAVTAQASTLAAQPLRIEAGADDPQSYPLWIDPSLVAEEGQFNYELFHPTVATILRDSFQQGPSSDGCLQYELLSEPLISADWSSLGAALKTVDLVLLGQVVGKTPGFGRTGPETLYEVHLEELLKGLSDETTFFFTTSNAEVEVLDSRFCRKDGRLDEEPNVGDLVLLLEARYNYPTQQFLPLGYVHNSALLRESGIIAAQQYTGPLRRIEPFLAQVGEDRRAAISLIARALRNEARQ